MQGHRRLPIGVEVGEHGAHFRVWAPRRNNVAVVLETQQRTVPLTAEKAGYFSGWIDNVRDGDLYRFRLDDESYLYPDPAARFQPEGPHGPSRVVDARRYHWSDGAWQGVREQSQVIYEMHLGTYTPEGTWAAASKHLEQLAGLGITVIEVMPIGDFPGRFGWGYDGVALFAPYHGYGEPDDARRFIDRAHQLGLGVILDVVYNHLGPDGNYLRAFAEAYFTDRYKNDWGEALNFHGPDSGPVREFFIANARYWVEEFHFDGLRLDATHQIFDASKTPVLREIADAVRAAAGSRRTYIVAENEDQDAMLARSSDAGGHGIDALWNDDFHHSAHVAMTGHREAYYSDFLGVSQEFVSALKWGYLYQGQHFSWQKKRRGENAFDLQPTHFVHYLQNHDQIANSGRGLRCHLLTSPGRYRALTAVLLLGPQSVLLFQGQEFGAITPFLYFADHNPDLAKLVHEGRNAFLAQFPSLRSADAQATLADPSDPETFRRCILDHRDRNPDICNLYADLLRLRREDPVFRTLQAGNIDGATLTPQAFVLRYFCAEGGDRLLVVNLGRDLFLRHVPEPLLAPATRAGWRTLWSSEAARYGGPGVVELEQHDGLLVPGESAAVLVGRDAKE
jgi:maltooligosyltrehalose trehalohydrolase